MKICHLCTGYPISFQGGITNYVRALAQAQQDAGNCVYVVSGETKEQYGYQVKSYASKKIHPMSMRPRVDKNGLAELKEFFETEQFDLIHIHMILDIDWDVADVLKPYRYVVSLHDYFYLCPRIVMLNPGHHCCGQYEEQKCKKCISMTNTNYILHGIERRLQMAGMKGFRLPYIPQSVTVKRFQKYKQLLEGAELLLPVSTRVQQIYENSGIRGNYQVLHIGNITADRYTPEFRENRDKDKIDVVMLGTLTVIKGADLLIELAARLDKSKFNVHFYGRSAEYAEKIREVGIIDHGPYQQTQLPEILANSDLGLVLSIWEDNGPQVVMEMLNNHVPVVGTRMGGIPDFVNENNGFLFDPYSEEEIQQLIDKLNTLTIDDIIEMKRSIRPTMTTGEHADRMRAVYSQIID